MKIEKQTAPRPPAGGRSARPQAVNARSFSLNVSDKLFLEGDVRFDHSCGKGT